MKPKHTDLNGVWDYRICLEKGVYTVREVYYDKNNKPALWSDPEYPSGESITELSQDIQWMDKAIELPVLEIKGNKICPNH